MPADIKATAINVAANQIVNAVRPIRDLSRKIITPVSKDVNEDPIFLHSSTVATLKGDTGGMKAAWDTAKTALDAAFAL